MVISCPCALVISIPLTFFGGIGGASKCGILVKGGNYLEALSKTGVAVFDKTGTLTKGVFKVTHTTPADGVTEADLLESAALAESFSNHPISKSLREACPGLDAKRASDAQEIAGHGVKTQVDGRTVLAGNARLMESEHIDYTAAEGAGTIVYVARDGQFLGSILISDEEKPTAGTAMQGLQAQGVRTVMLTVMPPLWPSWSQRIWASTRCTRGCCPPTRSPGSKSCWPRSPRRRSLPLWATASTTRRS